MRLTYCIACVIFLTSCQQASDSTHVEYEVLVHADPSRVQDEDRSALSQALQTALRDEYYATSFYSNTLVHHGDLRPFRNIQRATDSNIIALKEIFALYDEPFPDNAWSDLVPTPDSRMQACKDALVHELANIALYKKELIPAAVQYPDVTQLFERILEASKQTHLPGFERCIEREVGR